IIWRTDILRSVKSSGQNFFLDSPFSPCLNCLPYVPQSHTNDLGIIRHETQEVRIISLISIGVSGKNGRGPAHLRKVPDETKRSVHPGSAPRRERVCDHYYRFHRLKFFRVKE